MALLSRRYDRLCRKGPGLYGRVGLVTLAASGLNYDATVRNLELLGEAATPIPDAIRAGHPEIPWRQIIATRNQLIHGYLGIDNDIPWSIVR